MLMLLLAATTAVETPPKRAEMPCPAAIIFVSKKARPDPAPGDSNPLPMGKAKKNGPAVLMPGCKTEPRKKPDYPLA
jgi:hypothetical protein